MSQRLYLGLTCALIAAGGAVLWWAFSGPATAPPSEHPIDGLRDTTTVGWTNRHTATIDADDDIDALTALGYIHGMKRAWTLTVWRHTALGTLSATFGDELVPIDRHARRLGLAHHARRTYNRLDSTVRKRLRAYTRGLNTALQSGRVHQREPFLYFDLVPQRWAPWHSLAIERLMAWTGTSPVAKATPSDSGLADSGLADFRTADRRLRHWLHLHGRSRSVAWATRGDTSQTALFARHVLGATADPVVQEVVLRRPGTAPTVTATLPGAPLFPTGRAGGHRWTYLMSSNAQLTPVGLDSTQARSRHERIAPARGDEQLVEVQRQGTRVRVGSIGPDSAWVLQWPGLRAGTDLPRWLATANLDGQRGKAPTDFRLMQGDGLWVDSTGTWSVQGQPPVVDRGPASVLVGRSDWAPYQARVLHAEARTGPVDPAQRSAGDSSAWAAALLPALVPSLDALSNADSTTADARSYLRNWDAVYDPASIGAVVFEEWMRAYQQAIGHPPSPTDSAFFAAPRRRRAFRTAVDSLTQRYGTDVRRWRWERVVSARRYFPVWAADSLVAQDLSALSSTRFAPLNRPGQGHASALSGGPTRVDPPPLGPAPAHWSGWMRRPSGDLTVRRLRFDPADFFARSLLSRDRPTSVAVQQAPAERTTRLVPAAP
ncbi:penicillin acylase family protein [Salinibacter altiplanensis]|uniref:penicillin acylase family protein n=1 Tax=Salinibacter altiplanensis TaxID=1803181 RepID=UPI000C9ECF98|nr:penicillin acylase family protein [Salinibacter altiplanensis]